MSKRVVPMFKLDIRKIQAEMPKRDWILFQRVCIQYRADPNKLIASLIKLWLHSKDGREYGYGI